MNTKTNTRWLGAVTLLVTLLLLIATGWARPGGGGSYSSGRSSSSSSSSSSSRSSSGGSYSSSGGSSGNFGVPLLISTMVLFVIVILFGAIHDRASDVTTSTTATLASRRKVEIDDLRDYDSNFSQIVFEDFAFRLYATAHRSRTTASGLDGLAPYLAPAARAALADRTPTGQQVVTVVIGAMRPVGRWLPKRSATGEFAPDSDTRIFVEYETNITTKEDNHFVTYYVVERWTFVRAATVLSRAPVASQTFPCPNCGAPWAAANSGGHVCAHCNEAVDNGRFDWAVTHIELQECSTQPQTFTASVAEAGTLTPTVKHPNIKEQWQRLLADDPALSDDAMLMRVTYIYNQLNAAWASNDLTSARDVVSAGLYDYLMYSIATYRDQGLVNRLVDMRITARIPVNVVRDKYYDAVTFRIWATGKDYMEKKSTGEILHGSKTVSRDYTEYWTLIRSAARRGAPQTRGRCPNCASPLEVGQAGECNHCKAYLASGDFDWVLSKIEQDDAYTG